MTNKKEQIQSILNLMKSLDISIDDLAEKDLTEKKDFLTYDEAIDKADDVWEYEEGVYKYAINDKHTLVDNGVVLVKDADYVHSSVEGNYNYGINGKWFNVNKNK